MLVYMQMHFVNKQEERAEKLEEVHTLPLRIIFLNKKKSVQIW